MSARRHACPARAATARQRGALTVLFALMLPVVLCFLGVALDLALVYARRAQLESLADSVALAAAQALNGTPAGIDEAVAQASATAAGQSFVFWNSEALRFSSKPDTPDPAWLSATDAVASAVNMYYVKVDTSLLDAAAGTLQTAFAGVMGTTSVATRGRAVAGHDGAPVLPLAICAMGPASATRPNTGPATAELLQYGFRQGVGYNLLKLNAALDTDVPEYFLVDPIAAADGDAAMLDQTGDAVLGPYFCSGSMQLAQVTGRTLRLKRVAGFTLSQQLNSRFDQYAGTPACTVGGAPPDSNIRAYAGAGSGTNWLGQMPEAASAQPAPRSPAERYNTVADRAIAPDAPKYGPLWAFGPALTASGANMANTKFSLLYPVSSGSAPALNGSYSGPPYRRTSGTQFLAPSRPGLAMRRMLNIPLLACPVPSGTLVSGQVLAVGRFLMTAPADATSISAEFAGLVRAGGPVELYQ
jgi:Flp pilus assembly protein TadG